MKLLFKFMNFVTLNGFILNENEVKFPQKKNSSANKTKWTRNKKAKRGAWLLFWH